MLRYELFHNHNYTESIKGVKNKTRTQLNRHEKETKRNKRVAINKNND